MAETSYEAETVYRHTGREPDENPRRSDCSRIVSETDRILSYIEGEGEVHRQELLSAVRTSHSASILKQLREAGIVERVQGGLTKSSVQLTSEGERVASELITPLFRSLASDFSLGNETQVEYERLWGSTPPVERSYIEGPFRDAARRYADDLRAYRDDVATVNRIDRGQNPWR